jgi:hypothetical protein
MEDVISKNCKEVHEHDHFDSFIASRYLTTCTRLLLCFFRATRGGGREGKLMLTCLLRKACLEIITDARMSGYFCVCVWRIQN